MLHLLYHSATACLDGARGGQCDSAVFIRACVSRGIDVYLAPIGKDGGVYPSTSALEQAGAIPLPGLTEEAAFARLSLAYGTFEKDRKAARQAVLSIQ